MSLSVLIPLLATGLNIYGRGTVVCFVTFSVYIHIEKESAKTSVSSNKETIMCFFPKEYKPEKIAVSFINKYIKDKSEDSEQLSIQ